MIRSLTRSVILSSLLRNGKIAPMVERWIEAPRCIGSTPILPTLQEGSSAG